MNREIDYLQAAADADCLVMDKESHVTWSPAELREAAAMGRFAEPDCPCICCDEDAIESPFPGCLQCGGDASRRAAYIPIGETRHSLVFADAGSPAEEGILLTALPTDRDEDCVTCGGSLCLPALR